MAILSKRLLIILVVSLSAMPSFASDKDDIAKLMSDLQAAAINGPSVEQFFAPNTRLREKKDIDKLQATGFLKYQFVDYSWKDLTFADSNHAELPVTVAWSTRTEQASTTATLEFEKINGYWYFSTADFWELSIFLWTIPLLMYGVGYGFGTVLIYLHIRHQNWANLHERTLWYVLAFIPFSLPVYFITKPWILPTKDSVPST